MSSVPNARFAHESDGSAKLCPTTDAMPNAASETMTGGRELARPRTEPAMTNEATTTPSASEAISLRERYPMSTGRFRAANRSKTRSGSLSSTTFLAFATAREALHSQLPGE